MNKSSNIDFYIDNKDLILKKELTGENININDTAELFSYLAQSGFSIENEESITVLIEIIKVFDDPFKLDPFIATKLLEDILMSEKPSYYLEILRITGFLRFFLPELLEGYGCEQNEFHLYDVYHHLVYACDSAERRLIIRISALFHDIGKPRTKRRVLKRNSERNIFYNHEIVSAKMFKGIMRRFRFDKDFVKRASKLIQQHMFHYTMEWTDSAVRRFIRNVDDEEMLVDLFALRDADRQGSGKRPDTCIQIETLKQRIKEVMEKDNAPKVTDLVINGTDLMNDFDIAEGPVIGKILIFLLEKVVEDENLNNKESLYHIVKEYLKDEKKI